MSFRWLMAFVLSSILAANAQVPSATDITVRLASTQTVREITIVPVNATLRMCETCAAELVPAKLTVLQSGRDLTANGRSSPVLRLDGNLHVTAGTQHFSGAGRWTITPANDGLHLAITLPSERYVKAVLTAESAQEPAEALKAQAVVARTFALMNPHRHAAEGLCDSTHCQALRLDSAPSNIAQAVDATAGETLWFGRQRAETYFTQSCGGRSATWPRDHKPWLTVHADPYCERVPSNWRAAISETDLRKTLGAEGWKFAETIRSVSVVSRDASGRAAKLRVADVTIDGPSFRFAIDRQLGWNRIRSDLYTVSPRDGTFVFEGKGYGHGVGLCQFGAREMAHEGRDYRQILAFYFPGTQVRTDTDDTGWHEEKIGGTTLRMVGDPATVPLPAGSAAQNVTVTVYPTTELFRQATNEPGWMLGATRGNDVALQPVLILEQHGGVQRVLKHELTHVEVERHASPNTPLWLREGLTEYLAGEPGSGSMPLPQLEQALRQPRNLAESQRAHNAAAARVRALVQQYGLQTVRGWVNSGHVPPMQ